MKLRRGCLPLIAATAIILCVGVGIAIAHTVRVIYLAQMATPPPPSGVVSCTNFARIGALSLAVGEDSIRSSAIDNNAGFAYFGTGGNPATIVKVQLSDFTRAGSITIAGTSTSGAVTMVIDTTNGFLYVVIDNGVFARLHKINLSTFTDVADIDIDGTPQIQTSAIDIPNQRLYLSGNNDPAGIQRYNLTTFAFISTISTAVGAGLLLSSAIDQPAGLVYFAGNYTASKLQKVNTSTFAIDSTLTLSGEGGSSGGLAIDSSREFMYLGTTNSPGKVVKVRLSDFTRIGAITFNAGELSAFPFIPFTTTVQNFAYFSTSATPIQVVKVNLNTFTQVSTITLNAGESTNNGDVGVFDTVNGFMYLGTGTSPGIIVKIQC